MGMSLNNRLVGNNEVLTGDCSVFTVPLAPKGANAAFADMKDADNTTIVFGQIKALWIVNPIASGVDFWLRGPGNLVVGSATAGGPDTDKGLRIQPGTDTFLPMNESALISWGGNQEDLGVNTNPLVFVVFR